MKFVTIVLFLTITLFVVDIKIGKGYDVKWIKDGYPSGEPVYCIDDASNSMIVKDSKSSYLKKIDLQTGETIFKSNQFKDIIQIDVLIGYNGYFLLQKNENNIFYSIIDKENGNLLNTYEIGNNGILHSFVKNDILVMLDNNGKVSIWNLINHEEYGDINNLFSSADMIVEVNGNYIGIVDDNEFLLIDFKAQKVNQTFSIDLGYSPKYFISNDNSILYIVNVYYTNYLNTTSYEIATGKYLNDFNMFKGTAYSQWYDLQLLNDSIFAVCYSNKGLRFWDLHTNDTLLSLQGNSSFNEFKAFSYLPEKNSYLTFGDFGFIIWHAATHKEIKRFLNRSLSPYFFTDDSKQLVGFDWNNDIVFHNSDNGTLEHQIDDGSFYMQFLPSMQQYYDLGQENGNPAVIYYNWHSSERINAVNIDFDAEMILTSPNKKYLFIHSVEESYTIDLLNNTKWKSTHYYDFPIAFTYDDKFLVTSPIDTNLSDYYKLVTDADNGDSICIIEDAVFPSQFFPKIDNKIYYLVHDEGIYELDLISFNKSLLYSFHTLSQFNDIDFAIVDNNNLVTITETNSILLYNYNENEIIDSISFYDSRIIKLSLSDDHTKLAVSYLDGTFIMYDIGDALSVSEIGNSLVVSAFPNPFSETTTISYNLPQADRVAITIFDALGNEIAVPVNEYIPAGEHNAQFNGTHLQSGIYYYSIRIGSGTRTGKMILVK